VVNFDLIFAKCQLEPRLGHRLLRQDFITNSMEQSHSSDASVFSDTFNFCPPLIAYDRLNPHMYSRKQVYFNNNNNNNNNNPSLGLYIFQGLRTD
jgi:hypothetical protein